MKQTVISDSLFLFSYKGIVELFNPFKIFWVARKGDKGELKIEYRFTLKNYQYTEKHFRFEII